MRNYKYSPNSQKKIDSTIGAMGKLCAEALIIANSRKLHCPDFGISHGLRTAEEQYELFMTNREKNSDGTFTITGKVLTNCDGIVIKSSHQSGKAIDFYAYVDGKTNYEPTNMALIATCFFEAASNLGINIDWGGSFRSISDGAHIEILN